MKNLWLVLLLAIPLGCNPADSTTTPSDSNSTSAAATPSGEATHDAHLT